MKTAMDKHEQEATQYSYKPERVTKKKDKGEKRDFNKLYNDLLAF